MDLKDILERLGDVKDRLREGYFIKQIGVFGSYIRGEERQGSDLDVLVEFYRPIDLFRFMDLERELSEILQVKVDLVSKKSLKPFIGERVLKEVKYV